MPDRDDDNTVNSRSVAICTRILNDTIAGLADRFGVSNVVMALTEVVGCSACVSSLERGKGLRQLLDKLRGTDPT